MSNQSPTNSIQQQQEYLKKLLGKHEIKSQKVQNYLKLTQTSYEQKIKTGIFQIKQTSDVIQHKNNHKLSKKQIENMKNMKNSLEKNLKIIDSRIEQLTQPDKKSNRINDQQRLKFVSQMTKARKQLQRKRQKQIQQTNSKEKQIKVKQQQQQKKKQIQAKQKRKQQILKRAESLQVVRKNKKVEFQNQNKQLKAKMQQKILSERLVEKYKQHQQNILEQRKKKLAAIRSIHQPLTKSQFQLHLQKIDKLKSQRSRAVNKSDISRYISNDQNKFYKSKWYNKTKNQEKQKIYQNQKHEEQLEQLKQMKDKLKKYSQYVKQNFKPQIDVKKAKQISQKNKSIIQSPKTEDLRQLGLKYLQWSKQHNDPTKGKSENDQEQSQNNQKVAKPINYLQQMKKKNKPSKSPQDLVQQLKKNKNLPEAQKAQKILEYAEALEKKAKMRQQKAKLNKVLVDEQLDSMYIQAIQMKLSMLNKS